MKALVVAIVLIAATAVALAQPVEVRGKIVDAKTKAPVGGAVITVGNELAASDDEGNFTITLYAGTHTFVVTAPWLDDKKQMIAVKPGIAITIEVDEAKEVRGETVIVEGIAPTAPGETRIDAKTARMVPGGGDAAKVVQSLPAVARPPTGSSEIVVWGAAPRDTRVFVDGVPVPALYHVGGYRAAVGNDLIGDIRLVPAAFGPERGRAIGGVIDISLADPEKVPVIARIQVDPLDVAAATKVMLTPRFSYAAAGRFSVLDRAIGMVADPRELAPNAPLPRWADGQSVIKTQLRDDVSAKLWWLVSHDRLDRTLPSDDPATETTQTIEQTTVRAALALRRDRADGFDTATLWIGQDINRDDLRVGLIPASLGADVLVGGARAIQQTRIDDRVSLTTGLDLDAERARYERRGSLSIPAREGDLRIFGQPPGDDVNADRWRATTVDFAAYASVDLRLGRVTATAGLRGDGWLIGASRLTPRVGATPGIGSQEMRFTADPRVAVAVQISDEVLVRADAGRYHQARAGSDASAVFGTPNLGLEQALHATLGTQYKPAKMPLAIELVGYARKLDDLVSRDPRVTPLFARALTQDGEGDVIGIQVTGRVVGYKGLTGWLAYTLSKSTRRDAPVLGERLFDRDQTHGLIAVAGYQRDRWTVGGRIRVATGEPRTDVIGSFFDSRSGRFQPIRGEHNGVRLPIYFAADVRGERTFAVGKRWRGALYLELQNLTNRGNPEEIIYSADFSQRSFLTGLPLLAIAGGRLEL